MKSLFIGIAGGSGSGKTTLVRTIINTIGKERVVYIDHDSYYRDRSNIDYNMRNDINYDNHQALENELLIRHLHDLYNGIAINKPIYDFKTHTRKSDSYKIIPKKIIIVDGILILAVKELRDIFDIKIFVDTDSDIRFIRRMQRDINERNRTIESVCSQYMDYVRPMFIKFVEPTKRYADVIIKNGGYVNKDVEELITLIKSFPNEK